MHRTFAVALVAAIALALAGCGSGERTETVGSTQLVHRLVSACRAGERAGRAALGRRFERVSFVLAQRESLRTTMDEIDHLEATGPARANYDAYKRTVQTRLEALDKVASADEAERRAVLAREAPAISEAQARAHGLVVGISEELRMQCF